MAQKNILIDCPKCGGKGKIYDDPLTIEQRIAATAKEIYERRWIHTPTVIVSKCESCGGKGKVWVKESYYKEYHETNDSSERG